MNLVLAAVLAGLVAIAVTIAIERLGGRLGGLLGTLPTTIVPSSIGMATNDPEVFQRALNIAPAGMLLNALFLWLWRVLPARLPEAGLGVQLALMVGITLSAWAVGAGVVVGGTATAVEAGVPTGVIGTIALLAIIAIGVAACMGDVPAPRGRRRVGPVTLLVRGLLAGGAIYIALQIAAQGYGLLGGMASVFPAIFMTAMVSVWWSQGRAVSGGAVGPMMLGSASVAGYALLAGQTMPTLGTTGGAVTAWIGAVIGLTLPAHAWLSARARVQKT